MAAEGLWPLAAAPPEALRLLGGARRAWSSGGPSWGTALLEALVDGVRAGRLDGRLWAGPSGEAIALALWVPGTPAGRTVTVVLDEGFRAAAPLAEFVARLGREPGAPALLALGEPVPGLPPQLQADALRPLGFRRALRLDYRFPATAPLPPAPPPGTGIRRMTTADAPALTRLWRAGYADDPIERALARHAADPADDAAHEVALLLGGELGPWWDDASFVVPDPAKPGELLAGTVVNDHAGPLLTQVIVAPSARRRGLARAVVAARVAAVRARGPEPLRLVVTLSNERAVALYEALGFRPVPDTLGGYWFAPAAFLPGEGPLGPPRR